MLQVSNFLPAASCRDLIARHDAAVASGVTQRDEGGGRLVTELAAFDPALAADVAARTAAALAATFPELPPLTADSIYFARLMAGGCHPAHADAYKPDGTPNHTPGRVAAAVLYLNGPPEFRGGVLVVCRKMKRVVPRPGLLVGFPSTLEYTHAVGTVRGGNRDSIALFFKRR
jgi:predicted 2-oxoglutarate/Fe(II)-dependent dioxygenase YbiX